MLFYIYITRLLLSEKMYTDIKKYSIIKSIHSALCLQFKVQKKKIIINMHNEYKNKVI